VIRRALSALRTEVDLLASRSHQADLAIFFDFVPPP
jgi:hypothetical protein